MANQPWVCRAVSATVHRLSIHTKVFMSMEQWNECAEKHMWDSTSDMQVLRHALHVYTLLARWGTIHGTLHSFLMTTLANTALHAPHTHSDLKWIGIDASLIITMMQLLLTLPFRLSSPFSVSTVSSEGPNERLRDEGAQSWRIYITQKNRALKQVTFLCRWT